MFQVMKNKNDLSDIHRLWLKQLSCEYTRISHRFKLNLSKPVFSLTKSASQLGAWDSKSRTIYLSEKLISQEKWTVVLEVFKHEIAHQIVDEVYKQKDSGHDAHFQRACSLLCVEDWARHASIKNDLTALAKKNTEDLTTDKEKTVLRRVRKLLGLAQSSNQHEACLALKKAQDICLEHSINCHHENEFSDYMLLLINHKKCRIETYQSLIASLLSTYFYVEVIHNQLYDPKTLKEHKVLEVYGSRHRVKVAEHVYWFLIQQLDSLWQEYKKQKRSVGLRERTSFLQGAVSGFSDNLAKLKKADSLPRQEEKGLILLEKEKTLQYIKKRYPKVYTSTYSTRSTTTKAWNEGVSKGKKIKLYQSLEHKKNDLKFIS